MNQMPPETKTWHLWHGGQIVAELDLVGVDMPSTNATVRRLPGFAAVEALFAEDLRLLDLLDQGGLEEWERVQEVIRSETRLTDPYGIDVPENLLHIDGSFAWWRWNDQPFENE